MEKITTLARSLCTMLLALTLFTSCSKTAGEPTDEQMGPKETVVLPMYDISDNEVGAVYIDRMNSGRAQARIELNKGSFTTGEAMKANATLQDGTMIYAHCTDVNGTTGKCSTFPIRQLKNNSDAMFGEITTMNGLEFNVLDKNGTVIARSGTHTVIMH